MQHRKRRRGSVWPGGLMLTLHMEVSRFRTGSASEANAPSVHSLRGSGGTWGTEAPGSDWPGPIFTATGR